MRQALHIVVGIAFWALTVMLWWLLWAEHKATGAALFDSAARVAVCIGIVLGLTMWWVSHNVAIHRRKGPRRRRLDVPADTTGDRLGRAVAWRVAGGVEGARTADHLVLDVDGDLKVYRGR